MLLKTVDIAESTFRAHQRHKSLVEYQGIVSIHAFARLAEANPEFREDITAVIDEFLNNELSFRMCNYQNYRCGGNGTAYLFWKGLLPQAEEKVRFFAEELMNDAPKSDDGLVQMPNGEKNRVFIDQVFAVTPFMLFAGLALNEKKYIDEAVKQAVGIHDLLFDDSCGLLNQSVNFHHAGNRSQDHWSRGNGWGLYGLGELIAYLPDDYEGREEVEKRYVNLIKSAIKVQDEDGMWHQEMTVLEGESYVETSGTGLILYTMGLGLERGLLGDEERKAFEKGLNGYLSYISLNGDVHNTCVGCLSPNLGRIEDYYTKRPKLNDAHAFGPVTLAFGQAQRLGIETIKAW